MQLASVHPVFCKLSLFFVFSCDVLTFQMLTQHKQQELLIKFCHFHTTHTPHTQDTTLHPTQTRIQHTRQQHTAPHTRQHTTAPRTCITTPPYIFTDHSAHVTQHNSLIHITPQLIPHHTQHTSFLPTSVVSCALGSVFLRCMMSRRRPCTHPHRVCIVADVLTAVLLRTLLPLSGEGQWLFTSSPEQPHGHLEVGHSLTCHTSRNIT